MTWVISKQEGNADPAFKTVLSSGPKQHCVWVWSKYVNYCKGYNWKTKL